ncbi:MAG: hypothetical protein Q7U60_04195 [Candidatus Methanoperedens sp.]|nr:hypothetical protein [Candidatus Methanoperedens sp.]
MKMICNRKIVINVIACVCAILFYGTSTSIAQSEPSTAKSSKAEKILDKCLVKRVKALETKTGSKITWSWSLDDANQDLRERRENFNIQDGTFCYGVTLRGNQKHLLCGENDPYMETMFLYNLHGLDPIIVERECGLKTKK